MRPLLLNEEADSWYHSGKLCDYTWILYTIEKIAKDKAIY